MIFLFLELQGHAGPKDIADGINRQSTTVTGRLGHMNADGYVEKYRESRGSYTITEKGRKYLKEAPGNVLVGTDLDVFEQTRDELLSEIDYRADWKPWD